MIKQPLAPAAIAAVAAVVAVWAGAPVSTVLPIALLLVCPVMMLLMMRSMSGETTDHDQQAPDHDRVRDSKGSDVS